MFECILEAKLDYQLEKVRNAISNRSANNIHAATHLGISIIENVILAFMKELEVNNKLANLKYDLDNYLHALSVMTQIYQNNPNRLTDMDAWIYYDYIDNKLKEFVSLAQEIIEDK